MDKHITLAVGMRHEIVGVAQREGDGATFVAVHLLDNTHTPYVTWVLGRAELSGAHACFFGHYLQTRIDALEDMVDRVAGRSSVRRTA